MATDNNRRHVFISHHHRDDAEVTKLTNLLGKKGVDVRNSSIRTLKPENQRRWNEGRVKDETIRRLLRKKISWAGTVIVLVGKETHSRKWVDWEIRQAHRQGKRIVGIYVRGGTKADLPPSLEKYASDIRAWNAEGIVDAINGSDTPFQNPDGATSPPIYAATSTTC